MRQIQYTLYILFSSIVFLGQSNSMGKLFFNLPLEKNVNSLNQLLSSDTLNFTTTLINNERYYYKVKTDTFFNTNPAKIEILVSNSKIPKDSVVTPSIILFVHYDKATKKEQIRNLYNNLVTEYSSLFDSNRPEYIKAIRTEKHKKINIDEWSTYFYKNKDDKLYKLVIGWTDEKKYGFNMTIIYTLDN